MAAAGAQWFMTKPALVTTEAKPLQTISELATFNRFGRVVSSLAFSQVEFEPMSAVGSMAVVTALVTKRTAKSLDPAL